MNNIAHEIFIRYFSLQLVEISKKCSIVTLRRSRLSYGNCLEYTAEVCLKLNESFSFCCFTNLISLKHFCLHKLARELKNVNLTYIYIHILF